MSVPIVTEGFNSASGTFRVIIATLRDEGFWGSLPAKPIPSTSIFAAKVRFEDGLETLVIEGLTGPDWERLNGKWSSRSILINRQRSIFSNVWNVVAIRGGTTDTLCLVVE